MQRLASTGRVWRGPRLARAVHPPRASLPLALFIAAVLMSASSLAGPPTTDTPPPDDTIKPMRDVPPGLLPVMKGETRLVGTVLDRSEKPLPGMQVKIFIDGMMCREVATDAVGQYDFKHAIHYSGKETVVVWFVDPTGKLVPKALILAESPASREAKLLSPCFIRVMFEEVIESRVHLFDKETRAQQLFASGCI